MRKRIFPLPDFLRGIILSVRYTKASNSLEVECSDDVANWQNLLFRWNKMGENVKAYYDEILYFHRDGSSTEVITVNGTFSIPLGFGLVCEELNPKQFLQVHEDYAVYIYAVKKPYYRHLILATNGVKAEVPVGPSFREMSSEFFNIKRNGKK